MSFFAHAIPFFVALIGVELLIAGRRRTEYFSIADSVTNLSCGVLQEIVALLFKIAMGAAYVLTYERLALWHLTPSFWTWVLALVGVDFFYYWFHRASHRVAFFWAFHVVHHQSEEYNLTVALRQSALGGFFSWIFYLPLALVGLPPEMFAASYGANLLYQFWIHTRIIKTLGPLEWVWNTPAHHRVHHGRNPKYLDKNYAGALVIWDRWFGTFQKEEESPVYGIVKPLRSWNPLWANVHVWSELAANVRRATGLKAKLRCFTKPPGWEPSLEDSPMPLPQSDLSLPKYRSRASPSARAYVVIQFVLTLAVAAFFFFQAAGFDTFGRIAMAGFLALSLLGVGAILDGKRLPSLCS